ncbi:uncharacterized protein BJ212DRAFT_136898 [Suillus subaureus]|uniref:Pentacotripeptide-repeat region of PRORP domain-containing protein n=1 Tax=Suillus subaureus TaxID=48587 RepID=A0A9P7EC64_9AGAM|nr:uncharacterized protein BJ212DRAFT_136898 [Suillus subaureus]KAG1817525.1 hypothetical protein BJ212DRAFT_136898 [Suillus subaureus]
MLQSSFRRVLKLHFAPQRLTSFFCSTSCSLIPSPQNQTDSHNKTRDSNSSNIQDPTRCVFRSRVNGLLRSIDSRILAKGPDDVETHIHDKISVAKFHNVYRSTMFNRLIRFLLERDLFKLSISVYKRMLQEQFLPSRDIVTAMTEILDDMADAFVTIRNVDLSASGNMVSVMVTACMRAGQMSTAERWLKKYEGDCMAQGVAPGAAPYAGILETLQEIQPENSAAVQATLYRMRSEGVAPDISVFNALIRSSLARREYTEAFGLYHAIMVNRSASLLPSDLTFKKLFHVSKFLAHKRSRKHKRLDNAVPPRQLFRDMVQCHLLRTRNAPLAHSNIVSVSCLHLALRTFMTLEDYPAALMTLRAFDRLGFQPNLQTYLIVVTSLVLRIKQELGHSCRADQYRFADFITHMRPREPPDIDVLERRIQHGEPVVELSGPACVGPETVTHLLTLGEPTTSSRSETAHAVRKRLPTSAVPTVDMLMGATPLSPFQELSLAPLVRLLRKMTFVNLFKKAAGGKREGWDWKVVVGPILSSAKEEMWRGFELPPESRPGTKRKRRGYIGAQRGSLPFSASRVRRMVKKNTVQSMQGRRTSRISISE